MQVLSLAIKNNAIILFSKLDVSGNKNEITLAEIDLGTFRNSQSVPALPKKVTKLMDRTRCVFGEFSIDKFFWRYSTIPTMYS